MKHHPRFFAAAPLLLAATLLLEAVSAAAAGINLSWDDCGSFGVELRTFACDTNAGTHVLVGSFVAPTGVDSMSANEILLDLQSACGTYPEWWSMRTGLCRAGSLGYSLDFTSGFGNCYDYWRGAAVGGISMDAPAANRTRIKVLAVLPPGHPFITSVSPEVEVYSFRVVINSAKTVGAGACEGCQASMCIVLNSIKLNQPAGTPRGSVFLSAPLLRHVVEWQSGEYWPGHIYTPSECVGDCPVPALARTWGQVKSLYR